jgi:hypothetical protein
MENFLGLELELDIMPIYKNQPLFFEVCKKMDELQFDFISIRLWERSANNTGYGQIIFGDGLFLRSLEYIIKYYIGNMTIIKKYITILLVYNKFDLFDKILVGLESIYLNEIKDWNNISLRFKKRFKKINRINKGTNIFFKFIGTDYSSHILY